MIAAATFALAACGSDTDDSNAGDSGTVSSTGVSIADPWSRQPADGQTLSAVYGVLSNDTETAITITGATASVSQRVELHETTMSSDGQMSMNEKDGGFTVEPGESLTFEPGGPHVMLFDVDPATYPAMVDVTLQFDDGGSLDFTAEVRAIGTDTEMDHSGMDGEMDMDGGMDMDE